MGSTKDAAAGAPRNLPVPLGREAQCVYEVLVHAGGEASVPVIAALAGMSGALARRNVQLLAYSGLVLEPHGGVYEVAPWPWRGERSELPPEAWSRATSWHLSCVFAAARALRCDALPNGELIERDPGRPPVTWGGAGEIVDWYQGAHPELVEVLERAVAQGDDRHAWRLAVLMSNLAVVAGPGGDWERVLALGRNAAERGAEPGAQAMVEEYAGRLALHHGDYDEAIDAHTLALARRREDGDRLGQVRSRNGLGLVLTRTDPAAAETEFSAALELAEEIGDELFRTFARLNLAACLNGRGRWEQARTLLAQVVAYLSEHGPSYHLADALATLAATYRNEGDHPQALATAQEAVREGTEAELPLYLRGPLAELGEIHYALGDPDAALTAFGEARSIHAAHHDTLRAARLADRIAAIERVLNGSR